MNGHKIDFRLYAVRKINMIDGELPCDHLFYHDIDYFQLCIVDMIPVGNNAKVQLEETFAEKSVSGSLTYVPQLPMA